jgi:phosphoribosylglycinamide formyltransferase-1
MCSGWLHPVSGLPTERVINIHPTPRQFGGKGMWGHHAHEAVMAAFWRGEIKQSGVMIHYVTDYEKQKRSGVKDPYDKGPLICFFPLYIRHDDTPLTLAKRVNEVERVMQARVLNLVVQGHIWLDASEQVCYTEFARSALLAMGGMPA